MVPRWFPRCLMRNNPKLDVGNPTFAQPRAITEHTHKDTRTHGQIRRRGRHPHHTNSQNVAHHNPPLTQKKKKKKRKRKRKRKRVQKMNMAKMVSARASSGKRLSWQIKT